MSQAGIVLPQIAQNFPRGKPGDPDISGIFDDEVQPVSGVERYGSLWWELIKSKWEPVRIG